MSEIGFSANYGVLKKRNSLSTAAKAIVKNSASSSEPPTLAANGIVLQSKTIPKMKTKTNVSGAPTISNLHELPFRLELLVMGNVRMISPCTFPAQLSKSGVFTNYGSGGFGTSSW